MTKVYENDSTILVHGEYTEASQIEIEVNGKAVIFTETNRYEGVITYESAEGVTLIIRTM